MSVNTPAVYADVFEALERTAIRYVVVSGVAVALHGHVRPVYDLDIVVSSTPDEQSRVLQAMLLAGFVPSIPLPLNLVTVVRMLISTNVKLTSSRSTTFRSTNSGQTRCKLALGRTPRARRFAGASVARQEDNRPSA